MRYHQSRRKMLLFTSFMLLPVSLNYFSPYLIIDGLYKGIISAAFLLWGAFFLSSLLVGRAACAYVCPYGGLQMTMERVRSKPLKEIRWLRYVKHGLGAVWAFFILYPLAMNLGELRLEPLYLTENIISADNAQKLIFYYFIVVVLGIMPYFVGKRATCHYLCPMSILNIAGTKLKNRFGWTSLRLVGEADKCVSCGKCTRACTMSLPVGELVRSGRMEHTECIMCGECSEACGTGAVYRKFCSK